MTIHLSPPCERAFDAEFERQYGVGPGDTLFDGILRQVWRRAWDVSRRTRESAVARAARDVIECWNRGSVHWDDSAWQDAFARLVKAMNGED